MRCVFLSGVCLVCSSFGGGTGTTPAAGVSSGGFGGGGGGGGEGGLFSGLGGKPSEEKANTNVFGQASFGQATTPQGSSKLLLYVHFFFFFFFFVCDMF